MNNQSETLVHIEAKPLALLLREFVPVSTNRNVMISGLAIDSREVVAGDLFFAYPGEQADGRDYIHAAIKKGAVAVVSEARKNMPNFSQIKRAKKVVPIFALKDVRYKIGNIAAHFYNRPSVQMTVIGVTGTNGKTSICQFLAQALEAHHLPCAMIGTLGASFSHNAAINFDDALNTTPDPVLLQKQLATFKQSGAKAIAMEVTSQGLVQGRVNGVCFDIALFTNLSRDHLDLHGTMENYAAAKNLLFQQPGLKYAIINLDDAYGLQLAQKYSQQLEIVGYSLNDVRTNVPTIKASDIQLHNQGFKVEVNTPWGSGTLQSRLLGRFNVSNLLAVLGTLGLMGIPLADSLKYLSQLATVTGRMQSFGGGKQPLVVVDYAHTPDALQQALMALREHCRGKIWCVFGCGGDRDKGKRPLMGKIAEQYSDQLIITSDNPRHEDPNQIIAAIKSGLLCPWATEIISDRGAAIAHAIDCSSAGDAILIAGKGHEAYQQIGDEKLPFSDIARVKSQLEARSL